MNWNEELLALCHTIKNVHSIKNTTFGVVTLDASQADDAYQIVQDAVYPRRINPESPYIVSGTYGEDIRIDPNLPVQALGVRAFQWSYPRYERISDQEVREVPDQKDIAVELQLVFYKGETSHTVLYHEEYSLAGRNDAIKPVLNSSLVVNECMETGYEGHGMGGIVLSEDRALAFVRAIEELI